MREKKRGLFGSKQVDPLGPDRVTVGKAFARAMRTAAVDDAKLELLAALAAEFPDEPDIRLANAEALYRGAYIADAIDEYRYCQHLHPDDAALTARLGELYAMVSRNHEAVEHLTRGLTSLRAENNFEGFAAYCARLVEAAPDSGNAVHEWLTGMPEDAFAAQRNDVTRTLDTVREHGADDGRWADIESRLGALPEVSGPAGPDESVAQPSPWSPDAVFEPASEDEMRMLLGPALNDDGSIPTSNGVPQHTQEADVEPPALTPSIHVQTGRAQATADVDDVEARESVAAAPAHEPVAEGSPQPAAVSAPPTSAASAAALPPGLAAYTRRKGDGMMANGDFSGAIQCYERLIKSGFDSAIAAPLLGCYLNVGRVEDAAVLGRQLAEEQAAAGQTDKAVETLSKVIEHTPNVELELRRAEFEAAPRG